MSHLKNHSPVIPLQPRAAPIGSIPEPKHCQPVIMDPRPETWTLEDAAHLARRAAFGCTPDETTALHRLGPQPAVESLLTAQSGRTDPAPPAWADPKAHRDAVRERADALRKAMREAADNEERRILLRQQLQRETRRTEQQQAIDLTNWWIQRMITGSHPLREKMTLFWHGHFATSIEKARSPWFMFRQNELFRSHALGSVPRLTREIARDPAMMIYLDIHQSRAGRPNENYARELLELFTLGEGNYTEDDIRAAARALTGLSLNRATGESTFAPRRHDSATKTFLGETGRHGPDDLVRIIFQQPACARHFARKLWRHFVNDAPTDAETEALAAVLKKENFEIAPVLRTLFLSEAFYERKNQRALIKSPVEYYVQLARHLELPALPPLFVIASLRETGQILFRPPNVAGWPGGAAWINTNTLFARYNTTGALLRSRDPEFDMRGGGGRGRGAAQRIRREWPQPAWSAIAPPHTRRNPEKLVDTLAHRFFQTPLRPEDRARFVEAAATARADRRTPEDIRLARLTHLMLSTPFHQLT